MVLEKLDDIKHLLQLVTYKNWTLVVGTEPAWYLQWKFEAPEYGRNQPVELQETWYSRKWMISGLNATEIIRTAFKAARNAELHECEEAFKFAGRTVYSPHHDIDDLFNLAIKTERNSS